MRNKEARAKPLDVQRRWNARIWLTDAIMRACRDGIDCAPALDLLEALENLDAIEIVENIGTADERVVHSTRAGPAATKIRARKVAKDGTIIDGQVTRTVGKTDRMLTMPELSETIVSGGAGGRGRTPAESLRVAFACAAIERLRTLGTDRRFAIAYVEDSFGPTESDYKKIKSGMASDQLVADFEAEASRLAGLNRDEVILQITLMEEK